MLYNLAGEKFTAQIETWDEKVIAGTPSMRWAIGKDLDYVLEWLDMRSIRWRLTNTRKPSLSTIPLREISDAELFRRVAS